MEEEAFYSIVILFFLSFFRDGFLGEGVLVASLAEELV